MRIEPITIQLQRAVNPHRPGSIDRRRFDLLRDGMTAGEFIVAHNAFGSLSTGGLGERWHAVRYLRYMQERGFLTLPGFTFATRERALSTTPLSDDLGAFTFGVEFECFVPRGYSRQMAADYVQQNAGVMCTHEPYNHTLRSHWKVVTDGSLGYRRGAEFVSPVLQGQAGLQQVESVARALRSMRARVSASCGFHVHVGARSEDANFFRNLLRLYGRNEVWINSILPPSRHNNRYCQRVRLLNITDGMSKEEILRQFGGNFFDRNYRLNIAAYARHGTVEFRQAAGTVDADKASYWIKFCLRMCAAAKAGISEHFNSLPELLTAIGCTEPERAYFIHRADRLRIAA